MKILLLVLSMCLLTSVGLNVYLLTKHQSADVDRLTPPATVQSHPVEVPLAASRSNPLPISSSDPDNTEVVSRAQALVDQGLRADALEYVQTALRRDPKNIALLLIEADLLARRLGPADALANYYALFALPLNATQRQTLQDKIEHLAGFHIENLWQLKSWDVLSDFLEPLWQFAPNQRSYILPLAEAYAFQNLQAPMENVLASLMPDDPDVTRIRQLFYQNQQQFTPRPDASAELGDQAVIAQGTPLRQMGDHYIVSGRMNDNRVELMIDTGASTTVLTENAFNRIASQSETRFIGQYRINTAGGQVIAPVYKMQRLSINGYQVNDLAVVVLALQEFADAEGLLGMNFLREFDFRIDQNSDQLFLNDRRP